MPQTQELQQKFFNCESNLSGYSGTSSAFKPEPVHRRSHARIPERIERFHGQNVPERTERIHEQTNQVISGLMKVVTENMQWKEN